MHNLTLRIAIIFIISSANAFSQIPDGYYDNASEKIGEELKGALNEIIKAHTEKSYGDARYILDETDVDPDNAENVLVIYSDHSVSGTWDAGVTWNREHVWAKSRGIGDVSNSTRGAGSDLHNLRACITDINSARNNRWFSECDELYEYEGEPTGSFTSSTDWLWKPRDEDKGDVARIIFYMATRYEGEGGEPDLEVIDYIPTDNYTKDPIHALLSDLLNWHIEDPVSVFELNRNEVIFGYQNNRNPFIDHPEFVNLIWGTETGIASLEDGNLMLYPNPTKGILTIRSNEDFQSITIYNIMGTRVKSELNISKTFTVNDLPQGQYMVVLKNSRNSITKPLIIME
ncbi:MAG: endonuclease [Salinivirgaceae bacterium]|jgi:endonuclease I|nr:endonuclease [Salinivirgaceae bacterium]